MSDRTMETGVVIGLGAIGAPVAGRLAASGALAGAFDPWREHVDAMNRGGLIVRGSRGDHVFPMTVSHWDPDAPDNSLAAADPAVIFICTKALASESAIRLAGRLAAPQTVIVSLQNGLAEERLVEVFGNRVVGAVTETGGYVAGPGEVVETRADGGFVLGELDGGQTERLISVKTLLDHCAATHVSLNILGDLWSKLIWNCMMNAMCAVTAMGQGEVITSDETRQLVLSIGREAAEVAAAAGVALEPLRFLGIDLPSLLGDDPAARRLAERHLVDLYRRQMGKSTSMSQDVAHGRRTEIDALNGFIVRKAGELGLSADCNAAIANVVAEIESHDREPGPDVVEDLAKAMKESVSS